MVFNKENVGGGLMKAVTSEFGLLTEPSVVLHAMNGSE